MSGLEDLLREVPWERQATGELSDAYVDDLLLRVAALYDTLPEEDPDRFLCQMLVAVLTGVVTPADLRRWLGPVLERGES